MKELLQQYSAYNHWANKTILQVCNTLGEEQLHQDIVSSFPSVYKTLLHMMDVERIWFQRLKLSEQVEVPSVTNDFSYKETVSMLLQSSSEWEEWVKKANEVNILHVFEYRNSKKELFKQPVYEVIMQLVNHQTYHRGQIVTMLRQLGITKIPSTDFITFLRKK